MYNKKALKTISERIEQESAGLDSIRENSNPLIEEAYEFLDGEEYQPAFEMFMRVISEDNSNIEALNGLGITLCEMNRFDEALVIFKRACRLDANDACCYSNLANVYWELCDYEKALQCYQKAIDLNPESDEAYYNLIGVHIEMNNLHVAFMLCREFMEKFPDDPEGKEMMDEIILDMAISAY